MIIVGGSIGYISNFVSPPAKAIAGGRGYVIKRELSRLGYRLLIIISGSNQHAEIPALHSRYIVQQIDVHQICSIRTLKYSAAKSLRLILSWLDFEWQLLVMPKRRFSRPGVLVVEAGDLRDHYRAKYGPSVTLASRQTFCLEAMR